MLKTTLMLLVMIEFMIFIHICYAVSEPLSCYQCNGEKPNFSSDVDNVFNNFIGTVAVENKNRPMFCSNENDVGVKTTCKTLKGNCFRMKLEVKSIKNEGW